MAAARAWVGIDLGTSSLKVLAVDDSGDLLDQREVAFTVDRPQPDRAEGDPAAWTRAVDELVEPWASTYDLRGVGITGQMHGTVLLDEHDVPVRPAVLWPDSRSRGLRRRWDDLAPQRLGRLGNPWSPGMTGPVLAWLADREPETVRRAARVTLPKDLVRAHLVPGSRVTDPSDASGTLLYDVAAGAWLDGVDALVPDRLLPPVAASSDAVGSWRGATVTVGGGDTPVSLLALERAIGGWQPGDVVVNLGTGAQVIDPVAAPPSGAGWPSAHTYADAAGRHYGMVAAQNAGLALSWAQERLGIDWERFGALVRESPAGAGGVVFSPFVAAERGALESESPPGWTPDDASLPQAARAAAESQAFLVRRSWELLDTEARRVLLVGGGARSTWVQQLLADVLGRPVRHVPMRSASAAGAVLLAGGPLLAGAGELADPIDPKGSRGLEEAYARWLDVCYPET